jgi:predicted acylesterase/phospholipase RssA
VWISAVDFYTGGRYIVNIKDNNITYDDYLKLVNASASIPLAVEPVKYKGMVLYDGGVRNHILSAWAFENIPNVTETISVFSRPKDFSQTLSKDWREKNMITIFERYADISIIEISKRDEKEERLLIDSSERKIKSKQIFLPHIIKELFDTDSKKLRKLYNVAFKVSSNSLKDW